MCKTTRRYKRFNLISFRTNYNVHVISKQNNFEKRPNTTRYFVPEFRYMVDLFLELFHLVPFIVQTYRIAKKIKMLPKQLQIISYW